MHEGLDNLQTPDVSAGSGERAMEESVRWVSKVEAAEELEISLSTLDRMIRRGEVEVRREGRRVYVRMQGPEYITDEELLERTAIKLDESERTVRDLRREASELERRISELEEERDETWNAVTAGAEEYRKLEEDYRRERATHGRTKRWTLRLGLLAAVLFLLLVVSVLVAWYLLA